MHHRDTETQRAAKAKPNESAEHSATLHSFISNVRKNVFVFLCVSVSLWWMVFPAQADDVLHLYNWNNYISAQTVERFERQCACRVVQDYYSDNEEMLAKLAAGATGYDIIVPTGNAMESLIRQHALRPLDKSKLPNLKNLNPAYLNTPFDPGNLYSVPYAFTLTLIGYNAEKMRELGLPTDTWAVIFEPAYLAKLKGRVTVLDSQRELMAAALRYLGYSANDTDEAHWERAANLIIRAKPYWAAFNASSYIKELTVGNIWLVHGYSNDIFQASVDAKKAGRKFHIAASIPREGAVLSLDSMVLHKSGPRPELALQFINFMLDGANSAELTNLEMAGASMALSLRVLQRLDAPASWDDDRGEPAVPTRKVYQA